MKRVRKSRGWVRVVAAATMVVALGVGTAAWRQYQGRRWDGVTRFTVVRTDPVEVVSFDPATGEGVRLKIPGDLEVETAGGRGKWPASTLGQLGYKFGWQWVGDSVTWFLGVPVTVTDRDWGWWDRIEWIRWRGKVRWKEVDIGQTTWMKEVEAPDGVIVGNLTGGWEEAAGRLFASAVLASDDLQVKVVNASGAEGLGKKAGDMVLMAGIRVVMVTTESEPVPDCEVRGEAGMYKSAGVQFLLKTFGCQWRERAESVGDVAWVLGGGFKARWAGL